MKWAIGLTLVLLSAFVFHQRLSSQENDAGMPQAQTQELQGQIGIVEAEDSLLFVERNAVSYCFRVTPETKIVVGSRNAKIEDLVSQKGKSVTIKFRAERDGRNMAEEITVP